MIFVIIWTVAAYYIILKKHSGLYRKSKAIWRDCDFTSISTSILSFTSQTVFPIEKSSFRALYNKKPKDNAVVKSGILLKDFNLRFHLTLLIYWFCLSMVAIMQKWRIVPRDDKSTMGPVNVDCLTLTSTYLKAREIVIK